MTAMRVVVPSQQVDTFQFPDAKIASNTYFGSHTNLHVILIRNTGVLVKVLSFPKCPDQGVILE